ncbi:MAG: hypothetical protein V3T96_04920 [Thermodesulfobacteriota bacterium]
MKKLFKIIIVSFLFLLPSCKQESSVWISGWKETTPLIEQRAGAAVILANGYIYMIGGVNDEGFLNNIEYAKIQKDGSLGSWKLGPSLNEERGHAEAVLHNGVIYIVGGSNGAYGGNLLRSAESARIQPDGSLTRWKKEKSSLITTRRCSMLVVKDNYIYAVGGYGGTMLDNVERAEILSNGDLGEWVLEPEIMAMPRYVNGVKESRGVIYVVGGHAKGRGGGLTDVEYSRIKDKGGLQPWKLTSPLKNARFGLGTAVYGDYLYALGGIGSISGLEFTGVVEKAKIGPNGELAPWQSTTPLSQLRGTFNTVVFKDWVYILGGAWRAESGTYHTSVEYATFNSAGDIGFWGSKAEEVAYKEKLAASFAKDVKPKLPNKGVVKEILQTDTYTYIQVSVKGGDAWLAAPKIELDVNTQIRFSEGNLMSDFYSKTLDRTFPTIYFVELVKKVETK